LGIGDWGLGQSPIPNPQTPIPHPHSELEKIYLHKIAAIRNKNSYLIADNYGNKRGWIGRAHIYGKVDKIL
jgi:hypothetical protein